MCRPRKASRPEGRSRERDNFVAVPVRGDRPESVLVARALPEMVVLAAGRRGGVLEAAALPLQTPEAARLAETPSPGARNGLFRGWNSRSVGR